MEYLVHIANIFLLISFSVKSILLLRALNIIAGTFFITWAFLADTPIWSMIGWNALFAVINIRQIWLAILERRPPQLNPEEQELQTQDNRTEGIIEDGEDSSTESNYDFLIRNLTRK